MARVARWDVALLAAAVAGATSHWLLGAHSGLSVANAAAYGAFGWLSVVHWGLLHAGNQPWVVARWSGTIGGFSLFVALAVLLVGVGSAPVGSRAALAAFAFGTTWAGVGLGVSLARADAARGE